MKIIFFFSCLVFTNTGRAQLLKATSGTDLTIAGGSILTIDGFTLTPTADFTISDNTLTKSTTISHAAGNPYISRVYQFANTPNPFSGSVQINYSDGAELNSIPEGQLTLNVYNGTGWVSYAATTRDGTDNFVLTTGLSAVTLNELTLADVANPLPLVWLSFTTTKQNQTVLLQWATAQEQNTRNFAVQHSTNGINWAGIGALPAAGNSSIAINYSFVHATPANGINHYRILQTDMDNKSSYSNVKTLRFTTAGEPFFITGNPVTNNVLTVQVNMAAVLALYTADGKLLWQQPVQAGTKYIDVSRYAKGAYLLKSNSTTQKIVIQ